MNYYWLKDKEEIFPITHVLCLTIGEGFNEKNISAEVRGGADIVSRVPRVLALQPPRRLSGPCISSRYRP